MKNGSVGSNFLIVLNCSPYDMTVSTFSNCKLLLLYLSPDRPSSDTALVKLGGTGSANGASSASSDSTAATSSMDSVFSSPRIRSKCIGKPSDNAKICSSA